MEYVRLRILYMPRWTNVFLLVYRQPQNIDSTMHFYSCHRLKLKISRVHYILSIDSCVGYLNNTIG